ncbi:glycosyltransferase family 2 protein [Fusicatenibacter saccharivorans]|uniref:glycosyltransferase family 2 protein n=1 Tax=Fusicatenibacter saccharivorans TaxID=1150298 RepID=UPI003D025B50
MENKRPILSIYVATYNHEKYIVQALESIRMQQTKYPYEVLVGEDCSSDNTRAVLKDYEKQHPGFMHVFYREHNMHNDKINNVVDLKQRCTGKYIIALEGDDYWIDPYKIEKQISFLESHDDYIAVSHNCIVVNEKSEQTEEKYPECYDTEYELNHYMCGILPGQLATVMYRNYLTEDILDTSFLNCGIQPGDKILYFTLVCNGKVHCIQEKMSAYRHITSGGSSYSANVKHNFKEQKEWYLEQLKYANRINNQKAIKIAEYLYLKEIIAGVINRDSSIRELLVDIRKIDHKLRSLYMLLINR